MSRWTWPVYYVVSIAFAFAAGMIVSGLLPLWSCVLIAGAVGVLFGSAVTAGLILGTGAGID